MKGSISAACLTELKKFFILKREEEKNDIEKMDKKYIEKIYLEEIAAVEEQCRAARIAIEKKLRKHTERAKHAPKPEGWTGKTKTGYGWKEYEYRFESGRKMYIEKMAICKGWKCGKEFPHNYDCCQDCYKKPCTRCGQQFGNPYKPMCKMCYGETNATYGKWKKVKKTGYAFK